MYCIVSGEILVTSRMLVNLARWPTLLGTSDLNLYLLLQVVGIPPNAFEGQGGDESYGKIMEASLEKKDFMAFFQYYHPGALARVAISCLRSSLITDRNGQGQMEKMIEQADKDSLNLTYKQWIQRLWDDLHGCKKFQEKGKNVVRSLLADSDLPYDIYHNLEHFESTVRRLVIPSGDRSLSHLVLKTAWEGEYTDSIDGEKRFSPLRDALQLDSYYATMVRGACVKACTTTFPVVELFSEVFLLLILSSGAQIPLTPDIWCSHDEMQHTGDETQHFFRVMWEASTHTHPAPLRSCTHS